MNRSSIAEILESVSALSWTADSALCVTSISGLGIGPEEARDHPLLGALLPEVLVPLETLLDAHRRALLGQSTRLEFEAGGRCWLGMVEPLRAGSRAAGGTSATVFDHTERAFVEKSLRLSEHSYRSLIEGAPFAIARATPSGHLLQVNRAMVEMLRYEAEQELLIQMLNSDIFSTPKSYKEFTSSLRPGAVSQGAEAQWRCSDGKLISVSLAGRAMYDNLGRVTCIEVLAEDITEKKQLEHQLRQAQKLQAVGQLAGGIAHDFNNLLTIINGQVQMALAELSSNDPLRERLEDVEAAAGRAAKLTRQLLAFGRFQNIESKVLDLNAVVSGMTQMLVRLIGKNVELKFFPSANLDHIKADTAQMEQVIMNLVLNAKDATPDGGCLTISTENVHLDSQSFRDGKTIPPGDYVTLTVVDTGHGMSPETMARIFEPFFTTKKLGEGTGLGLATVYTIVKQNKGFIDTKSEIGSGSRFTIYLPRVAPPTRPDALHATLPVKRGSETILLAEDEEIIRKFASSFLSGLGYRVLCASDGLEALELAKTHPEIDLLITDIVMPRMGGRELAEELHQHLPALKILFISGYAADPSIHRVMKALNAQLLQKPFPSMPAFAKCIRDALDRR